VKRLRHRKAIAAFLVFLVFVAQSGMLQAATSNLTKLILNKTELALEIGDSAALTATAVYANGRTEDVTIYADWSSDNNAVATVYNGIVTAKGEGTATVLAVYEGKPQSVQVTVTKKVKALIKDRQTLDLRRNETAEIVLTAVYQDNASENVSDKAEWSSGDTNIATVVNGKVTAHNAGSTVITAKYGSQTVTVPVRVEIVQRLIPAQKQVSLLLNDTFPITLTATYPDGTTRDVAAEAEWTTSDPDVADVIRGVITAYGAGTATLTASYGTKTATIEVDVDKTRKLSVNEQNVFMKTDESRQLTLTATYPDGRTADITNAAEWSSSDENVVSVTRGLLDALKPGTAVITAKYGAKSMEITVDVETTRYLLLSEDALTLKANETKDITLQAVYVDGSAEDITDKAKWSSNRDEVAYVRNGRVYANKTGSAIITASYGGKQVTLTVDVDIPRRLYANPNAVSLQIGETANIQLLAVYASGQEELVTDKAEWTTSSMEVADVNKGVVTGIDSGSAVISAKYGGRTATVKVDVGLVKTLKADVTTVVLGLDESKQIVLTAEKADGSSVDVTKEAVWTSKSPTTADVNNGLIRGVGRGKTSVTAEYGGQTVTIAVEVDQIQKLEINKRTLSLKSNEIAQLTLTAVYSDGRTQDVTAKADWKSSSYQVAEVNKGLVTAVAAGKATITASYGSQSVTVKVDVDSLKYLQTDIVVVTMKVGETKQIQAIATYLDGTEADVTRKALWTSSQPLKADVKDGLIRAHDKGKVTITVSYGDKKTKVSVTIQ
jgi:uncharacterized protein YjdB